MRVLIWSDKETGEFNITVLKGGWRNCIIARVEQAQVRDAEVVKEGEHAGKVSGVLTAIWGATLSEGLDSVALKSLAIGKRFTRDEQLLVLRMSEGAQRHARAA